MRIRSIVAAVLAAPFLVAAAAPQTSGHSALIRAEARLASIAYHLTTANRPWCADLSAQPGWLLGDRRLYSAAGWPAARAAYGASDEDAPFVAALVPNGPAARAGFRLGEAVGSINGDPLQGDSKDPHSRLAAADALFRLIQGERFAIAGPRAGSEKWLEAGRGCASEFRLEASARVTASADGRMVMVSFGMVDFAAQDGELAALVAHELAHNILRHRARLNAAGIDRGLLQQFGRNARLTRATENEADRLSIWLLLGAGYDAQDALRFWRRYGKRYGGGLLRAGTHPAWQDRVAAMQREVTAAGVARANNRAARPPLIDAPPPLE